MGIILNNITNKKMILKFKKLFKLSDISIYADIAGIDDIDVQFHQPIAVLDYSIELELREWGIKSMIHTCQSLSVNFEAQINVDEVSSDQIAQLNLLGYTHHGDKLLNQFYFKVKPENVWFNQDGNTPNDMNLTYIDDQWRAELI
jgi:hypothetical protein